MRRRQGDLCCYYFIWLLASRATSSAFIPLSCGIILTKYISNLSEEIFSIKVHHNPLCGLRGSEQKDRRGEHLCFELNEMKALILIANHCLVEAMLLQWAFPFSLLRFIEIHVSGPVEVFLNIISQVKDQLLISSLLSNLNTYLDAISINFALNLKCQLLAWF